MAGANSCPHSRTGIISPMLKYDLLLFDADGTLFDYKKAEAIALDTTLRKFGIVSDFDVIRERYAVINSRLWKEYEKGIVSRIELREERFKHLFETFSLEIDANPFSTVYLENLSQGSFLLEGAEKLIEMLHTDFKLAIITNGFKEVQRSRFKRSGLYSYFADIIISDEIGSQKPEPAIFEAAFKRLLHTDKKTALIIGDSLSSDIRGGINFGIDTCWYNPDRAAPSDGVEPTYTISDLADLPAIVDG
jgi:2-haloacid dehalogenase